MTAAQKAEIDAVVACSQRAEAAFPDLARNVDDPDEEPEFRVADNGRYLWTVRDTAVGGVSRDMFICGGNMEARTIEFVELNGVRKLPQAPEVWSY